MRDMQPTPRHVLRPFSIDTSPGCGDAPTMAIQSANAWPLGVAVSIRAVIGDGGIAVPLRLNIANCGNGVGGATQLAWKCESQTQPRALT